MLRMRTKVALLLMICISLEIGNAVAQTPLMPRDSSIPGPQTFAIIVGISKYKFVKPLQFADKDAELFRDYLRSPAGGSVKDQNIYCLLNERANNSNFWGKGFQWLKAKNLQRGDKLFLYLAGHGDAIDEDQFFFLGHDCNPAGDKNNYLVSGTIQLFNLKKKIAAETAKGVDVVFIMDACRSNELPGGAEGLNFLNTAISEKNAGEIIMLATGAGQEALEDAQIGNGHGLFTYYLVDGLNGLADSRNNPDNRISFREIQSYVDRQVPQVAREVFKRKQDPFFCCNEKSDQVISRVDSTYLLDWLKKRKALDRGPGNSVSQIFRAENRSSNDTALINLYNRFNQAVLQSNTTGRNNAANFYNELERKFPGNPYTLDARSSLAVAYLDFAQSKVDDYLACVTTPSSTDVLEAGQRLEKAIELFSYDDADFANSLLNRLYFLRSAIDNSPASLQQAHAAKQVNPNGAYIFNRLAQMHLANQNADSAQYYASRASRFAPKWGCALSTLSLVRSVIDTMKRKPSKKFSIGIVTAGGVNIPNLSFSSSNWRQGQINYNDSLTNIRTASGARFDLGVVFFVQLNDNLALRPAVQVSFEGGQLLYDRRSPTGSQGETQTKNIGGAAMTIPVPFVFKFSQNRIAPYFSAGPALNFALSSAGSGAASEPRMVTKTFGLQGDVAIGLDMRPKTGGLVISPELKYSHGFSNVKGSGSNLYLNTISSLKKRSVIFSLYFRKG